MDTTSIIGKDGTPVIVNSPGSHSYGDSGWNQNNGLFDLLNANNIAENSRAVLQAIQYASNQGIEASNRVGIAAIESSNRSGIASVEATNRSGVAAVEATNRIGIAGIKETTDVGFSVLAGISEARLATVVGNGEIRQLVEHTATTNLLAIKDADYKAQLESSKTREEAARQFALLAAQIAECCCEGKLLAKDTQALVIAQTSERKSDELSDLRTQLAILSAGKKV
jgi:hypothetical protein